LYLPVSQLFRRQVSIERGRFDASFGRIWTCTYEHGLARALLHQAADQQQAGQLSTFDYHKQRYANVQAAGGEDAYREQRALEKEKALSKLRAPEKEKALSTVDYHKQRYAKVQAAGWEDAYRKLRAPEKEKARAQAKAKALLLWQQGTEQCARDMATKVLTTLAEPGMKEKCLESIASGSKDVQDWTQVVRNYGKTGRKPPICFFDMEGRGAECPPYSATVAAEDFEQTWPMNLSPNGAASTLKECQVYPKP
jgi:hypothetical protein